MHKKRKVIIWSLLGIVLVGAIAAAAAGPIMSRVEQPSYSLIRSDGAIEIRQYAPLIIAEVAVTGDRKAAISEGFRRIAATFSAPIRSMQRLQ